MTRIPPKTILSFFLGASLFGCTQIMNIEEATCDPEVANCPNEKSALGPSPLCKEYCDTVMRACPVESGSAVYSGVELCLAVCKYLPPGSPGDTFKNSVECRLEQARAIERTNGEDLTGCPGAGPGGEATPDAGGPICNSACENFCDLYMQECTDSDKYRVFTSRQECLDDCATVPDLGGYSTQIAEGNTLQCRLWHLTAAADQAWPHCSHAAGLNTCVDEQ